jgi:hypothetical protein
MALHVCQRLANVIRDLRRKTRSRRLLGIAAYGRLFLPTRLRGSAESASRPPRLALKRIPLNARKGVFFCCRIRLAAPLGTVGGRLWDGPGATMHIDAAQPPATFANSGQSKAGSEQ